ncbi:MAG: hypothetical protein IIU47_02420 [Lachnospiraceae bacterium]|nr:hypothetical protein [Lachnospiraceae bacterium]MBQ5359882.1 hypothetical protein [Lachnospiraceae bacterium]
MQLTAWKAGPYRVDDLLKRLFFHSAEIRCTNGFPRGGKLSELRQGLLFIKISPETGNKKTKNKNSSRNRKQKQKDFKKEEIKNGRLVKT